MVIREGRFLKHYTKKYAGQSSNLSKDYPREVFLQIIKSRLNLIENLLMTNFAWRSVATALADTSILITNLKQVGRWKSEKVVEG
eukprot:8631567-Ditylum_brightwellii.AAC.1